MCTNMSEGLSGRGSWGRGLTSASWRLAQLNQLPLIEQDDRLIASCHPRYHTLLTNGRLLA